jgi:hypothetical protein
MAFVLILLQAYDEAVESLVLAMGSPRILSIAKTSFTLIDDTIGFILFHVHIVRRCNQ